MFTIMLSEKFFFEQPCASDFHPGDSVFAKNFITSMADRMVNLAAEKGPIKVLSDISSPLQYCFALAAIKAAKKADIYLSLFISRLKYHELKEHEIMDFKHIADYAYNVIYTTDDDYIRRRHLCNLANLVIEIGEPAPKNKQVVSFSQDEFANTNEKPKKNFTPQLYVSVCFGDEPSCIAYYGAVVRLPDSIKKFSGAFTAPVRDVLAAENIIGPSLEKSLCTKYDIELFVFYSSLNYTWPKPDKANFDEARRLAADLAEVSRKENNQ